MNACFDTIQAYGLRAIGIGERLLPKTDITLCEQMVLIGSGLIWNVYFGVLAIGFGFWFAIGLSLGRQSRLRLCAWYRPDLFSFFAARLCLSSFSLPMKPLFYCQK
jgi:hypothetical protein